jgi:hypothetical protein
VFKKLVQDELVRFYHSELWESFLEQISLDRGVRHAHLFLDSAIRPSNILNLTRQYFARRGDTLRRSIWLVSDGPGLANCYYIAPQDKCHFEILLRHNPDVVLEPMPAIHSIGGEVIDIWDDAYMERFYSRFQFRPLDDDARSKIAAFFESAAWNLLLETMVYNVQRNKHGHMIARVGVHPLEIEWEYDRAVVIEPLPFGITRIISTDRIQSDIGSIPYYTLSDLELAAVADRIGWGVS